MRIVLAALVVSIVVAFDMAMLFGAWFTLAFFEPGLPSWIIASAGIAAATCMTWLGLRALSSIRSGRYAV